MSWDEVLATLLLAVGGFFYLAGTVGLLRFPDVHSRLHALTKADNLGLFFVCTALALLSRSLRVLVLLALIWLVALLAATVSAHLIARHALRTRSADRVDAHGGSRPATLPAGAGSPRPTQKEPT